MKKKKEEKKKVSKISESQRLFDVGALVGSLVCGEWALLWLVNTVMRVAYGGGAAWHATSCRTRGGPAEGSSGTGIRKLGCR